MVDLAEIPQTVHLDVRKLGGSMLDSFLGVHTVLSLNQELIAPLKPSYECTRGSTEQLSL